MTISQMIRGVFLNRCPHCQKGAVFSGLYALHRACPACGTVYEKERGYFLGALVAAYFIGAASLAPTLVVTLFFLHLPIREAILIGTAQILLLHPLLNRFSKLAWIYAETRMTSMLDKR